METQTLTQIYAQASNRNLRACVSIDQMKLAVKAVKARLVEHEAMMDFYASRKSQVSEAALQELDSLNFEYDQACIILAEAVCEL